MKIERIFFLLLMVLFFCACTDLEEVPITDWVSCTPFPRTARASATTFVIGDKAYLCCGRTGVNGYTINTLNEVWQFDSRDDSWSQLDTFPGRPRVKAIGVAINGKGYVGMGSKGVPFENTVFNDFYQFDPETGIWTSKASFPGKKSSDLAYTVVDGCLYTALGYDGVLGSHETYKYDPQTDVWTRLKDAPHYYAVPAFFSIGNSFFVGSGFQKSNIRIFMRFDTEKGKWFESASLPKGRILSNGLEINGKGYVMLGRYWSGVHNGGRLLSDILEYDSNENVWIKRGDFPGGARQNAMVFQIQGRGYIVMGENDNQRLQDVWSFKP